jgi:serine phosphatase RsbU (regulator of sigma subunit)
MGGKNEETAQIEQIPLFDSLPHGELQHLIGVLRPFDVPRGTILFREGDRSDDFYVILEGEVEVIKALGTPEERVLDVLGPGDFLGEIGLLDPGGLRSASISTRTPVHLLGLARADFDALLQRRPILAYHMVRELSLRLRESDDGTIRALREKNRQLAEAYAELQAAQAQIIEKERLERELQVAREIQESILPREIPRLDGFDFGVRMIPARAVGGDLFDFISQGEDGLGVVVGDVADKGVPAGIFMALTRSVLRAEAHRSPLPGEVLRHVNQHLLEMNDAGMFVTMLYGVVDRKRSEFSYARAGHELPLLLDQHGHLHPIEQGKGQPLGIFDVFLLDEQVISLPPGSTLLIYSDGATDATSEQNVYFGIERLQEAVRASLDGSAQEICDRIWQAIEDHQGENAQTDDVTLLVVRSQL